MIVVSDTSCITNLIALEKVSLLQELFGVVVIPSAVARELRVNHSELPTFLTTREVTDQNAVAQLKATPLDPGEAEAIILSEELHADALLIDEKAGRAIALGRHIKIIGLLGILIRGKEAGLIPVLRPLLDQLQGDIGFWISPALRQRTLEAVGEA